MRAGLSGDSSEVALLILTGTACGFSFDLQSEVGFQQVPAGWPRNQALHSCPLASDNIVITPTAEGQKPLMTASTLESFINLQSLKISPASLEYARIPKWNKRKLYRCREVSVFKFIGEVKGKLWKLFVEDPCQVCLLWYIENFESYLTRKCEPYPINLEEVTFRLSCPFVFITD